jgi:glucokinase
VSFLGLDLGGTKISVGLMDEDHSFVPKAYDLVDPNVDILDLLGSIVDGYRHLGLRGIGLCVPGWMSYDRNEVRFSPHRPSLTGLNLAELLSVRTGLPVSVDNDANTAALLELNVGSLRGVESGVVVNFGTGVGIGVVVGGVVSRGANGFAGELGHSYFEGHERCVCGARGCIELALRGCFFSDDDGVVAQQARRRRYRELASVVLQWVVRAFDPGVIVVGGGIGVESPEFLVDLRSLLEDRLGDSYPGVLPKIVGPTSSGYAGAHGAALMSAEEVDRSG